jgi:hypothetical protein
MTLSKKSSYDCKEIERYVQQYIDGVLDSEKMKLFEEHLDYCLPCDKKVEFEKKLKDVVKIKLKRSITKEKIDDKIDDMLKDLN